MRFREFIKQSFSRVLAVDTEFRFDLTKTSPEKVVCFVYKDIFTGEVFRFWEHDKTYSEKHFDYNECLLVSFTATAEYGHVSGVRVMSRGEKSREKGRAERSGGEEAAARREGLRRELLLEVGVAQVLEVLGLGVVLG